MFREVEQCLYFWRPCVQFLQRRLQLGGDVADELGFQCIVVVCYLDGLLLFAVCYDEAQQHDATDNQYGS